MNHMQRIFLSSSMHFGSRLPPQHVGLLLAYLPAAVRAAISMSLRHRSRQRGRQPSWLKRAADIRFVGHEGNGQITLLFEAPTLGDAATELYQQGEFWQTRPDESDTGFDLLGDVLTDVESLNADSERFDPPLLRLLIHFRSVFKRSPYEQVSVESRRYSQARTPKLSPVVINNAESFLASTPSPHQVRLVGQLDMLRASTETFALRLDDGSDVRGALPEGAIESVKPLLNRRVVVNGRAVFRASGRLLRIDAENVRPGESESSVWSVLPQPRNGKLDVSKFRVPQGPRSGMAAILGKWPGDESEEEVQAALEQLS